MMRRCYFPTRCLAVTIFIFGYLSFFILLNLNPNNYYGTIEDIEHHRLLTKKNVTKKGETHIQPVIHLNPENFRRLDSEFDHYELPDIKYQFQCRSTVTNMSCQGIPEDILCTKRPRFMYNYKNPCWKENKTTIRCLPYYHIFGVCKSGTTDLFRRMLMHPHIIGNKGTLKKETWFWSWKRYGLYADADREVETLKDFINKFDVIPKRLKYNIQKDKFYSDYVTGHGDPMDIWYPYDWRTIPQNVPSLTEPEYITPHLIRHINPYIKLILLIRNPVDRIYSHYIHKKRGNEEHPSPEEFHYDTHRSMSVFYKCTRQSGLRSCLYDQELYNVSKVPLSSGFYDVFLKDWLGVFDKNQILVLRTEEYDKDINGTLARVFEFLELEKVSKDLMVNMCKQKRRFTTEDKKPMLNETKKTLQAFYERSQSNFEELFRRFK